MKWAKEIFVMECQRTLSYRIDFWLQFVVIVVTEIGVAYYLWSSIFAQNNAAVIGGMTFQQIIVYYALIPFVTRIVKSADDFMISREIFEGSINKYLIYPLSFTFYKFIQRFAFSAMAVVQLLIGMAVLSFFLPLHNYLSVQGFILGLCICLFSFGLYFVMSYVLELMAFWFDSVWSLGVMLRFITMFFGGAFIPLELFPSWLLKIIYYTPFPYLFSLPMQAFLGKATPEQLWQGVGVTVMWIIPIALLSSVVLKAGYKKYSGVGI